MTRKGQAITLSLQDTDRASLEALAREFGMTWGDKPNISRLIKAIAQRTLALAPNHDWPLDRLMALNQARKALVDRGELTEAIAIAHLLSDRSELTLPLQQELTQFLNSTVLPWRLEVDRLIKAQQPFRLEGYTDATGQQWQFTIYHGRIVQHQGREYLDCWCAETTGNQDLPELHHNWCFLLERYQGEAIIPVRGPWRPDLDRLTAEFHLHGRLAHSYAHSKHRSEDQDSHWLPDRPGIYRVVRSIYSSFWFLRELRQYGADCELVGPPALRERFLAEWRAIGDRYGCP